MQSFLRTKTKNKIAELIAEQVARSDEWLNGTPIENFVMLGACFELGAGTVAEGCIVSPGVRVTVGQGCTLRKVRFDSDAVIEDGVTMLDSYVLKGTKPGERSICRVGEGSTLLRATLSLNANVRGSLFMSGVSMATLPDVQAYDSTVYSTVAGPGLIMCKAVIDPASSLRYYAKSNDEISSRLQLGSDALMLDAALYGYEGDKPWIHSPSGNSWSMKVGDSLTMAHIQLTLNAKCTAVGSGVRIFGGYTAYSGRFEGANARLEFDSIGIGSDTVLQGVPGHRYIRCKGYRLSVNPGTSVCLETDIMPASAKDAKRLEIKSTGRYLLL